MTDWVRRGQDVRRSSIHRDAVQRRRSSQLRGTLRFSGACKLPFDFGQERRGGEGLHEVRVSSSLLGQGPVNFATENSGHDYWNVLRLSLAFQDLADL